MGSNNTHESVTEFATANYSNGLMKSIGAELGVMFGFIGLFILSYAVFHIVFKITLGDEDKTLRSKLDVNSGKGKNIVKQPNRKVEMNVEQRLPDGRRTHDIETARVFSQDDIIKPTKVTDDIQATQAASQDDEDKIESIPAIGKDNL